MTTLQKLETAPDLIKMRDVSQFLPFSYEQVTNLVYRGTVPHIRIGKKIFIKKSVLVHILEYGTDGLPSLPEAKPIFLYSK